MYTDANVIGNDIVVVVVFLSACTEQDFLNKDKMDILNIRIKLVI